MENKHQPAFSCNEHKVSNVGTKRINSHLGLTKLEYFSAMVLQGLLANEYAIKNMRSRDEVVEIAKAYANSLLEELDKKGK
jgi:hypothetical protein